MNHMTALLLSATLALGACGSDHAAQQAASATPPSGEIVTVQLRNVPAVLEAAGVAQPIAEATLSTRLMASVRAVHVREGDVVSAGQLLAVLDARDLAAKDAQIGASIREAEAMQRDAEINANRMRALYADEAAPKAQLDAAEVGLARANAALAAARAGAAELSAVRDYSQISAPFSGTITRRFVDPGAFATPGAPLLTIQDTRRLRVAVTSAPDAVRTLKRGDSVTVRVEGATTRGVVEGAVPAGGSVYTINAIIDNAQRAFLPGSAASVLLPVGTRSATLIPAAAIRREGDLTGVLIANEKGSELRWVRLGREQDNQVEVVAGIRDGERIVIPDAPTGVR